MANISRLKGRKWLNEFVQKNKIEILVYKAMMDIACQIKFEREKRGLSQRELAEITGLTQTTILRLEKGKNSNLETLFTVSTAMGLNSEFRFKKNSTQNL
ncbi:MAG: helix-turn-helix transcriptional regulator [bacterium]